MKPTLSGRYTAAIPLLLLLIASAVIYLPRIDQIGYMNDDWYLMYSAHAYGPQVFTDIYSIDRPARALVLTPAYMLFGDNPFYYNLSAYFLRLISGISFFWLLRLLWPRQRTAVFIAALLFLIYPGFLSQHNGIDYQSQMVSLAFAMLSIALSVQAALAQKSLVKALGFLGAVLLGWLYLGFVEYFLGLELLRFASLYIVAGRDQVLRKDRLAAAMRTWLPNLIIPGTFLIWRFFFFESERGATDLGAQLEQFRALPFATATWWLVRLLSNAFHVVFLAWGIPLYQFLAYISRLPELFIALACAGLLLILLVWFLKPLHDEQSDESRRIDWKIDALLLGIATAIAGLVPVILVNRQADFWDYSRYTLASSPGSALVLTAILFSLSSRVMRWGMLSLLVAISVVTHHANAIRLAVETESLRTFWWQVAWRAPQLEMDTTLVVNYPLTVIQEDYFVWGPANLIYYPDGVGGEELRTGISAAVLNKYSLLKIMSDGGKDHVNRRSIRSVIDYENILVMSMPITGSCVQVIDGSQPALSQYEEERIMLVASYSDLSNIDLNSEPRSPAEIVFGPEPAHGWCYYYEKADLARQRGNWEEVLRLGDEALDQGLVPVDSIEWMPFLQAYARAGDAQTLDEVRRLMRSADPFVIQQVCVNLSRMPELPEQVIPVVNSFCNE
ncbi:MAG TPA: hypothetical protein VK900_00740 [Anaerolineales bacterium]|nr:hypothetical protein [Anaerolineales bacterium]